MNAHNVYDYADTLLEQLSEHPIPTEKFETNKETFLYVRDLLNEKHLFPNYMALNLLKTNKSNEKALKCRMKGNEMFKSRKYFSALCAYNESLCHAESNSEALGIAFANRSAVYLEIGEFDRCRDNIRLAKMFGYPKGKFIKLDQREGICCGRKRKTLKTQQNSLRLSHKPNPKYPFVADCLTLQNNELFGRHIVTSEVLKAGDIIAVEPPFSALLLPSCVNLRCTFCFNQCKLNLLPCPGCTAGKTFF